MRRSSKSLDHSVLLHPVAAVVSTTFLGLASTLISPKWYSSLMNEPDFMYGNLNMWAYVIISSLLFSIYAWIFSRSVKIKSTVIKLNDTAEVNSAQIALAFSLILNFLIFYVLQNKIGINVLLSSIGNGGASELRLDIDDTVSLAKLNWVAPFTVASILWGYWTLSDRRNIFNSSILILTFTIYILSSLITLTRGPIFELIASIAFLVILKRMRNRKMNLIWIFRLISALIILLLLLFVGIDNLRRSGQNYNQNQSTQIIKTLIGYFPASYNRLAAVLDRKLIIPNSGAAYYTIQGLWDVPVISSLSYKFGRDIGLDLPLTTRENWYSQFSAVGSAGLQRDYIWATSFGFAFADWGWFGLVWFAVSGALTGYLYAAFKRFTVYGIVIYPFALVSIFQWWSISTLIQRRFIIFLAFSFMIEAIIYINRITLAKFNPTPNSSASHIKIYQKEI